MPERIIITVYCIACPALQGLRLAGKLLAVCGAHLDASLLWFSRLRSRIWIFSFYQSCLCCCQSVGCVQNCPLSGCSFCCCQSCCKRSPALSCIICFCKRIALSYQSCFCICIFLLNGILCCFCVICFGKLHILELAWEVFQSIYIFCAFQLLTSQNLIVLSFGSHQAVFPESSCCSYSPREADYMYAVHPGVHIRFSSILAVLSCRNTQLMPVCICHFHGCFSGKSQSWRCILISIGNRTCAACHLTHGEELAALACQSNDRIFCCAGLCSIR